MDPDGEYLESAWDAFNITLGIYSLRQNLKNRNYADAAVDAAGLAIDSLAIALPVIPAGAGAIIKASRFGTKAEETVKLFRAVSKSELEDIMKFGGFRLKAGGFEVKEFATSSEDAAKFGREIFSIDPNKAPFEIIEVEVPKSIANQFDKMTLDRKAAIIVPEESLDILNKNATIRRLNRIPINK